MIAICGHVGHVVVGLLIVATFSTILCCKGRPETATQAKAMKKGVTEPAGVAVTVLYDNNEYDDRLETAWGFSCLVEGLEKTILFDTGGDSRVLLSNMRKLHIQPAHVDIVVISHEHGDHMGGLAGFLAENSRVTVYLPRSVPERTKGIVRNSSAKLVEVDAPTNICKGAHTTGELGRGIKEQSLVVETPEGMLLITGCAHPGIVHILRRAEHQLDTDIHMTMGGFHLGGTGRRGLERIVEDMRNLGVKKVAPCHCSGDLARHLFNEAYGDNCHPAGVGWKYTCGVTGEENAEQLGNQGE